MLLRSASTPLLNSWATTTTTTTSYSSSATSSPETQHHHHQQQQKMTFHNTPPKVPSRMIKSSSDSDLRAMSLMTQKRKQVLPPFGGLGLGERVEEEEDEEMVEEVSGGGGSNGGDGFGRCGFGGGWDYNSNDKNGVNGSDLYFKKMVEANPGNSLILGNYAKYLKEVRGDYVKAEEYCGRAILANPSDANTLSMYGDLIWETQKDSSRAETYFDQAVKAAPDDCYVMASYARFLWDAEDEEEEEDLNESYNPMTSGFFQGVPPPPPLAAAF